MKNLRDKKDLTQKQLEGITKISQSKLSRYENYDPNRPTGKDGSNIRPMPEELVLIAKALECSTDYLMDMTTYPYPITEQEGKLLDAYRIGGWSAAFQVFSEDSTKLLPK